MASQSFFKDMHGGTFINGQFSNVGRDQINNYNYTSPLSPLQILSQAIADVGGSHNSEARYPPPRCYAETRREVRKYFTGRIQKHRGGCVYWLSGYAGVGKSAIAQTISEECERNGLLVASFFFSRNHPKRRSPSSLFLTIAYGLACSIRELQKPISEAIHANPAILTASVDIQFRELVVRPSRWLAAKHGWSHRPRLVIIDGLDECEGENGQKRVLSTLVDCLTEPGGSPLEFLFCSRPEPLIKEFFTSRSFKETFESDPTQPRFWWYRLEDDTHASRDIRLFLVRELDRIRTDEKFSHITFPDTWPTVEVLEELVWKSSEQFIYVVTIIKFISDEFSHPCRRLQDIVRLSPNSDGGSPWKDLDALYHYVLSVNPDRKLVADILGIVCYRQNEWVLFPSPGEIEILLDLFEGQVMLALRGMHSVLKITGRDYKITTLHKSFLDHLYDKSRSGQFHVDAESFASFTAACVVRSINKVLLSYQSLPGEMSSPLSIPFLWYPAWNKFCTEVSAPTEELLTELRNFEVDVILDLILQWIVQDASQGTTAAVSLWWEFVHRTRIIAEWLKGLPVRAHDLITRFEGAGESFHISAPDASVVDAILKLIGARQRNVGWECRHHLDNLARGNQEFIQRLGRVGVRIVRVTECRGCSSERMDTLEPSECSPGVFHVRMQHIVASVVPFLVDVLPGISSSSSSEIVRALLCEVIPCAGPLPDLLPLIRHILPEILGYKPELCSSRLAVSKGALLKLLVKWLKLFSPKHIRELAPIVQGVKEWTSHARADARAPQYSRGIRLDLEVRGFNPVGTERRISAESLQHSERLEDTEGEEYTSSSDESEDSWHTVRESCEFEL
ncbi:hypothetical protein V5O48_013542 [Marasmius crinis-equi]|uniref:Nephrocystin 3-like N-terminal domain-containing protein n=1 Tax=Marasmius crinis-equi TaxID=585013 RepID=A0ABR3F067_9AGAR